MKPSNKCIDLIKQFEGFRAKPYLCSAGIATIGYGSTFYEDGTKVNMKNTAISEARATRLLEATVNQFSLALNKMITSNLNQNQYDALVSFAYNIGTTGFKVSTLLKLVNANPDDPAIRDQFMRWNRAKGNIIAGLTNRRKKEADLYYSLLQQ